MAAPGIISINNPKKAESETKWQKNSYKQNIVKIIHNIPETTMRVSWLKSSSQVLINKNSQIAIKNRKSCSILN